MCGGRGDNPVGNNGIERTRMRTVNWNIKKMPIESKNRIKALASESGLSIPETLVQLERQVKRAEFIQLSKVRKEK